jgi:hypothetical protein
MKSGNIRAFSGIKNKYAAQTQATVAAKSTLEDFERRAADTPTSRTARRGRIIKSSQAST